MGLFISKLCEKRDAATSQAAFARELGIDPSEWSRVRRGLKPHGKRLQDAALARWPELAYYLSLDAQAERTRREGHGNAA